MSVSEKNANNAFNALFMAADLYQEVQDYSEFPSANVDEEERRDSLCPISDRYLHINGVMWLTTMTNFTPIEIEKFYEKISTYMQKMKLWKGQKVWHHTIWYILHGFNSIQSRRKLGRINRIF